MNIPTLPGIPGIPSIGEGGGTLVAGAFDPISLSPRGWWKADVGTWQESSLTTPAVADGDVVGGWVDQSGNGFTLTQATGGAKPTLQSDAGSTLNGRAVIRFDGTDDELRNTVFTMAGTDAATVFVVGKVVTKTSYGMFASYGAFDAGNWNLRQVASTGRLSFVNGANNIGAGATSASAPDGTTADLEGQGWRYHTGQFTTGNAWELWQNGASKDTETESFTQAASGNLYVGGRNASLYLLGDIAEILIFTTALSGSDRGLVETYLAARHGL